MKNLLWAGVASLFLAGATIPANAHMMKSPEEQQKMLNKNVDKLTKDLNLTPDQVSSVRAAMQTKMDKMNTAMQDEETAIKGILTADQAKKYESMESKEHKAS